MAIYGNIGNNSKFVVRPTINSALIPAFVMAFIDAFDFEAGLFVGLRCGVLNRLTSSLSKIAAFIQMVGATVRELVAMAMRGECGLFVVRLQPDFEGARGSSSLMAWSMCSTSSIRKLSEIVKAFLLPPVAPSVVSGAGPSVSVTNLEKNGLTDPTEIGPNTRRANRPLPAKRLRFFSLASCVR